MSKITKIIIKSTLHFLVIAIIFGTIGLLLWRINSMETPAELEELSINESLVTAYYMNGGKLTLYRQSQDDITRAEHNYGYFAAPLVTFAEEANQVQVLFRYNNSTLKNLASDYKLSEVPARDGDYFDLTLVVCTDLTPDNMEDNTSNSPESVKEERIHLTEICERDSTALYNYRKFIFDNVNIGKDTLAVYLDIYYSEDINYDEESYGTLCLYDYKTANEYVSLTKSDREKIEKFVE